MLNLQDKQLKGMFQLFLQRHRVSYPAETAQQTAHGIVCSQTDGGVAPLLIMPTRT